jgi:hypothetical protein
MVDVTGVCAYCTRFLRTALGWKLLLDGFVTNGGY